MGEIIVKVPGNVKQVFDNIDEALNRLQEIKRLEKQKKALEFFIENAGILPQDFEVSEEELHMQGD